MDPASAFQSLAIALGLGLLVGLQRQRSEHPLAGIRTFALVTTLGCLIGLLDAAVRPWLAVAGLLGVAAAAVVTRYLAASRDPARTGLTTEAALMVMYIVGLIVATESAEVGVVAGAGVAVLLQAKIPLHTFVKRLGEDDLRAIMRFALITLVILPVLPDRGFGPYGVLNPHHIWLMVVLIVGITLAGYAAVKFTHRSASVLLVGLLGGVISSTATTVAYSRRSTEDPAAIRGSTLVIALASTVVFVRVLVELGTVAYRHFWHIAPPIIVMFVVGLALSTAMALRSMRDRGTIPTPENPAEIRPAVLFGLLYAGVLLAVAWASDTLGNRGIYVIAAISGLTDMDAITLSTSRLVASGTLEPRTAWHAIIIASMSNLAFKLAVVASLGGRALLWRIAAMFSVLMCTGAALLWLWPAPTP